MKTEEMASAEVLHSGEFDFVRDHAAEKPNAAGVTFKAWKKVPASVTVPATLAAPGLEMPDAEFARRLRASEAQGFMQLAELLGNDAKALHAMREETAFVNARPDLPRGNEFAAQVRGWLVANKLEWSQENLEKAVASLQSPVAGEIELEAKS